MTNFLFYSSKDYLAFLIKIFPIESANTYMSFPVSSSVSGWSSYFPSIENKKDRELNESAKSVALFSKESCWDGL